MERPSRRNIVRRVCWPDDLKLATAYSLFPFPTVSSTG